MECWVMSGLQERHCEWPGGVLELNASADEPEAASLLGKRLAKGSMSFRLTSLSLVPLTGASGGSLMAKATSATAQTLVSKRLLA